MVRVNYSEGKPEMDLAGYNITFHKNPFLGWWSYTVETPDGGHLVPLFGGFVEKAKAEKDALRRIRIHKATETVSAEELQARVGSDPPLRSVHVAISVDDTKLREALVEAQRAVERVARQPAYRAWVGNP